IRSCEVVGEYSNTVAGLEPMKVVKVRFNKLKARDLDSDVVS
ncbi:hypothetical protein FHG87_011073, partial [Trinorchestia longiramus]